MDFTAPAEVRFHHFFGTQGLVIALGRCSEPTETRYDDIMVKLIVFGATGFAGGEVIRVALKSPEVTQVTAVARRSLENATNDPRLKVLIHNNFEDYNTLSEEFRTHDAVIWALGGKVSDFPSIEEATKVTHTYATRALESIKEARGGSTPPFHFCYLSGMGADRTESQHFFFEKASRYLKGRTEKDLLTIVDGNTHPSLRLIMHRPGGILDTTSEGMRSRLRHGLSRVMRPYFIENKLVAGSLLHTATHGSQKDTLENADMIERGGLFLSSIGLQ
ncbi:hypothetical protein PROFUN_09913 [Planoprotostelium fungivorum]|uniref:NAD(P)-binding domain-containing protein n=1 Tax=Planoprotostelium fungivorum TaxID=1890364 RepID=A0A2P6NGA8_9EUKA|nr:hypothetical protein PROFUN_09913 [Planoprotostelium fungivorum]